MPASDQVNGVSVNGKNKKEVDSHVDESLFDSIEDSLEALRMLIFVCLLLSLVSPGSRFRDDERRKGERSGNGGMYGKWSLIEKNRKR